MVSLTNGYNIDSTCSIGLKATHYAPTSSNYVEPTAKTELTEAQWPDIGQQLTNGLVCHGLYSSVFYEGLKTCKFVTKVKMWAFNTLRTKKDHYICDSRVQTQNCLIPQCSRYRSCIKTISWQACVMTISAWLILVNVILL